MDNLKAYQIMLPNDSYSETVRAQIDSAYNPDDLFDSDEAKNETLKFMLLFNVFEANLFTSGIEKPNWKKLGQMCDDLLVKSNKSWFSIRDYDWYGKFFADRYIDDNYEPTPYYTHLFPEEHEGKIYRTKEALINFKRGTTNNNGLFLTYLLIAYAFRNNLYHGSKGVISLNDFIECFRIINRLMHKLLIDMVDNDFEGLRYKYPRE